MRILDGRRHKSQNEVVLLIRGHQLGFSSFVETGDAYVSYLVGCSYCVVFELLGMAQSSFQNSTPTTKSGVPTPATPQVGQSGTFQNQNGFNQGSNFNTKGNQWNSNNGVWQQNNGNQTQFSQQGAGENQGSFRQNGAFQNNGSFQSNANNSQYGQQYRNPTATTTPVANENGYAELQGGGGCNANAVGQTGVGFEGSYPMESSGSGYYGRAARPMPTYRRGGFFRGFWGR